MAKQQETVLASPAGGWMERVRKGTPAELAALWAEAETVFKLDRNEKQTAREWLLTCWVAQDTDGAIDFIRVKGDITDGALLGKVLASLNPQRALEMANAGISNAENSLDYFKTAVAEELAQRHPELFFQIDMAPKVGEAWDFRRSRIALEKLAASDPAAAQEIFQQRMEIAGRHKQAWISAFLAGFSSRNAADAVKWVESQTDPEIQLLCRQAMLSLKARQDPHAALREAGDGTAAGAEARLKIVAALAQTSITEALRALKQFEPSLSSADAREKAKMMKEISAAAIESLPDEPAALLEQLKHLPAEPVKTGNEILRQKASRWSTEQVAAAAVELIKQDGGILTEQRRREISGWFADNFVQGDRDAATLARLLPEEARGLACEALSSSMKITVEQVRAAAEVIPLEQWTPDTGTLIGSLGEKGIPVISSLPETPQTAEIRGAFAAKWALADPEAAGGWVRALPEGASAEAAASGLIQAWSKYDEMAASVWIGTLPSGAARDGAASALVKAIASTDPEAARFWAESIANPALHEAALRTVAAEAAKEAAVPGH